MSAFKQLRDVSNNFEQQLRSVSAELFSAKIGETFEEGIVKKMQDLTFLTSKLRLLKAKPIAASPQIAQQPHTEDTIRVYGDAAMWKVLEQSIVKSLTQSHAVQALITAPDSTLEPDMVERKEKIIQGLENFHHQESQLRLLHSWRMEKEQELATVRQQWDAELIRLRDLQEEAASFEECDDSGPLYKKLRTVVDKLELMRWLVCRLVTSRGARDWLAAPPRTAQALRLARAQNTLQTFVDGSWKIIQGLENFHHQESQLRLLHSWRMEKEQELATVRQQWDAELIRLRDLQEEAASFEECDDSGPLYKKLRTVVDKLELMRWLVCRLVTSRGARDWLAAPPRTAQALRLARAQNTLQTFVDGS